jgi:hypothetical protein
MRNLAFILLGACSAYDPNLGATPFLCGDTDPKCPDGYSCNADSTGRMVCEKGGGTVDGSMKGNCSDDSMLEPNDTIMQAWQSPVATARMNISLTSLAICPGTDKDNYKVDITAEGQNLEVILTYDPGSALTASLLNGSGTSIVDGSPMGMNQVSAYAANLPVGSYYAQIFSATMMENNYRIDINVTGP